MTRKLLLKICLFLSLTTTAQQVVSSQGGSYVTTDGSLDFSLGEISIRTVANPDHSLTQGFFTTNANSPKCR